MKSISEVSQQFGLSASTLRYYEEVGLLTNVKRQGQKRMYETCHLNRLKTICCFKRTGMTIAQLQVLVAAEDDPSREEEVLDLLAHHADQVDQALIELQQHRRHIKRKQLFYEACHQARLAHQPEPDWQSYKQVEISELSADPSTACG